VADRILVVEDDTTIWRGLRQAFKGEGYVVVRAATAEEALRAATPDEPPDLVLVDLGLPDMDGVELCRLLRAQVPDTTIVILTARSSEIDVVMGLDAGADDYVTKPFRLAVLLARVRAHLRRRAAPPDVDTVYVVDGLEVDVGSRRVFLDGSAVSLRKKEFDLLALLVAEAGRVVTRERIMAEVWDARWSGSTKTLDMHISSLRRRLGPAGDRITTLRGVGHRFERVEPADTYDEAGERSTG
jgi:DNA-binding response OmpR family regulator